MSTAEKYRQIKKKRRAEERTYTITAPSGMYFINGQLPHSLTEKAAKALSENEPAEVKELTPVENLQAMVFIRDLVKDACVNPKIVEKPQNEDEISPSDLELDDFLFLAD